MPTAAGARCPAPGKAGCRRRCARRIRPKTQLDVPPPRTSRFRVLSRVHWVRPELAAEVKFLTWAEDGSRVKSSTRASGKTSRARDVQRPVSLEPRAARAIFRVSNGLYRGWPLSHER